MAQTLLARGRGEHLESRANKQKRICENSTSHGKRNARAFRKKELGIHQGDFSMSFYVLLNTIESIKKFGTIVINQPYAIRASQGDYTIDAKTVMSFFTFNTTRPILISVESEMDGNVLRQALAEFEVTCD